MPQIELPSLFDFTLVNSVRDMWQAKVYPLSMLIAVFSGFWPHCKLLLLLVCWHCPSTMLGSNCREQILRTLDAFGKWSLVDNYVLVMMMIAFRFQIGLAAEGEEASLASAIDVIVGAGSGFFSFLAATMLSMLLTHLVLAYHRAAQTTGDVLLDDGGREPLRAHRFASVDKRWLAFTLTGQVAVALLLLGSLVLLLVGATVPAFEFEFRGAAG